MEEDALIPSAFTCAGPWEYRCAHNKNPCLHGIDILVGETTNQQVGYACGDKVNQGGWKKTERIGGARDLFKIGYRKPIPEREDRNGKGPMASAGDSKVGLGSTVVKMDSNPTQSQRKGRVRLGHSLEDRIADYKVLWVECMYPPVNPHVKILTPSVMVLGGRVFGQVIEL